MKKEKKKRIPRKIKKQDKQRTWIIEFNKRGKKYGYNIGKRPIDFEDWKGYFDMNYTPYEAIMEDLSYCF